MPLAAPVIMMVFPVKEFGVFDIVFSARLTLPHCGGSDPVAPR
jgi:hypothetical protein